MRRWLEHINFPRIAFVLAVVFMVALGLCGLTAVFSRGSENIFFTLGMVELAVMVLSILGLFVTLIAWIVVSVLGSAGYKGSEPQRLFDDSDKKE